MLNGVQHHSFNSNVVPQGPYYTDEETGTSWSRCGSGGWAQVPVSKPRALSHNQSSADLTRSNLPLGTVFSITSAYSHPTTQ